MFKDSATYGFLIFAVVFIPLERLIPYKKGQGFFRNQWWSDLSYVIINGFLLRLGFTLLLVVVSEFANRSNLTVLWSAIQAQPLWLQVIEIMFVADLAFYWTHRLFHRVPMLWKFHAVHHSLEDLDWLAGNRMHFFDLFMTKGTGFAIVILLGFSPAAIGLWLLIFGWHSILLHSNVRVSFGPLNHLLTTPHFHRWHHAAEEEAYDNNFAGQLSILDRMFGTYYMPERAPIAYGIDQPMPTNWVAQFLYPLQRARSEVTVSGESRTIQT